jgi:hypothetical protein
MGKLIAGTLKLAAVVMWVVTMVVAVPEIYRCNQNDLMITLMLSPFVAVFIAVALMMCFVMLGMVVEILFGVKVLPNMKRHMRGWPGT